jgi:hypothetical protein
MKMTRQPDPSQNKASASDDGPPTCAHPKLSPTSPSTPKSGGATAAISLRNLLTRYQLNVSRENHLFYDFAGEWKGWKRQRLHAICNPVAQLAPDSRGQSAEGGV